MKETRMKEILDELKTHQVKYVNDHTPFPKPFIGKGPIKAIVLGADPSTKDKKKFDTVFNLKGDDRRYFNSIEKNLNSIGLDLDNVYVQNLCQNYFDHTTYENRKNWWRASSVWITFFIHEVEEKLGANVAILATSEIILKRLIYDDPQSPADYYGNPDLVPETLILHSPDRHVFPFYRHWKYNLLRPEWEAYRTKLTKYFKG